MNNKKLKVLLVGNGLEIMFNNALSKKSMLRNIEGPTEMKIGSITYKTLFPMTVEKFYDMVKTQKDYLNLDEDQSKQINATIQDYDPASSIEDIYLDIIRVLDEEQTKKFRYVFMQYVYLEDKKIDVENMMAYAVNSEGKLTNDKYNPLKRKLRTYDIIFTTNYTDLVERIVGKKFTGKVVHMHGEYNQEKKSDTAIIGDKSKKEIIEKVENFSVINDEKLMKKFNLDNTSKVDIDVVGMSLRNDHDVMRILIWSILKMISNSDSEDNPDVVGKYRTALINEEKARNIIWSMFNIRYFAYSKSDKSEFEASLKDKKEMILPFSWDIANTNDYDTNFISLNRIGENDQFANAASRSIHLLANCATKDSTDFYRNNNKDRIWWYENAFVTLLEAEEEEFRAYDDELSKIKLVKSILKKGSTSTIK